MRDSRQTATTAGGRPTTRLTLASRLDLPAADRLHAAILARQGAALELDAGAVSHLGALCLQVLIAAATVWRAHGRVLTVAPVSDAFTAALGTYGLTLEVLQSRPVPGPEGTAWA